MKVHIAITVHVRGESFGLVHGELDLLNLPRTGERISFTQPSDQCIRIPRDHPNNPLILTVCGVTHHAGPNQSPPLIEFSDMDLDRVAHAQQLLSHLQTGFGLYAEEW